MSGRTWRRPLPPGYFHDIGKVPLQLLYHYEIVDERVDWDDICTNERDRFGTDHQEIGFYMALEWKLPEEYRQVIRLHHENGEGSRLAELVRGSQHSRARQDREHDRSRPEKKRRRRRRAAS